MVSKAEKVSPTQQLLIFPTFSGNTLGVQVPTEKARVQHPEVT